MKKYVYFLAGITLIVVSVAFLASCSSTSSGGGGGAEISVLGEFSYPNIYVTDGDVDFSNYSEPINGNDVSDAIVTVSNETTGVSTVLAWRAGNPMQHGYYGGLQALAHGTGEKVSLRIETASGGTVTGDPTETSDSTISYTGPASGAYVHIPFTITWDFTAGTNPASHVWLQLYSVSTLNEGHQVVLPNTTTSLNITSAEVNSSGSYVINIEPVTSMTINGAKAGSVAYVKPAIGGAGSRSITVY
ncbi:MAG: hypothetical protein U9R38_06500 [Candidatus Margulisiibacteriota bacterium]|nr:hypothetical protein [Candidatus Margulisiibacteriota bacterium]